MMTTTSCRKSRFSLLYVANLLRAFEMKLQKQFAISFVKDSEVSEVVWQKGGIAVPLPVGICIHASPLVAPNWAN